MYLMYLGEVLKRAFAPTVRITDGLQIAAASALPAIAKFSGVKMPETINNDALSYIGATTVAFIFIRLFWAPYSIWKEDKAQVAELQLELTKPERLILEHSAKLRAKKRMKLFDLLQECYNAGYAEDSESGVNASLWKLHKATRQAGLPHDIDPAIIEFADLCKDRKNHDPKSGSYLKDLSMLMDFQEYLNDRITISDLLSRPPEGITKGKRP